MGSGREVRTKEVKEDADENFALIATSLIGRPRAELKIASRWRLVGVSEPVALARSGFDRTMFKERRLTNSGIDTTASIVSSMEVDKQRSEERDEERRRERTVESDNLVTTRRRR